jgi:murein DD-endopeptidase MepM/ murein hydrolase activator NlpD
MSLGRTSVGRAALLAIVCVGALTALPASAQAVALFARPDVLKAADVRVATSAEDTPGLGVLVVDGAAVDARDLAPSSVTTFAAVPLEPGTHRLMLLLRTRSGITHSAAVTVRSWRTPAMPACALPKSGLQRRQVVLVPSVGGSTSKFTVLLNGKAVLTKTITAPSRIPVTLALAPGCNAVELRAENPVARTSKALRLFRPVWPVPGYYEVGSKFGPRNGRMHKGIDIHAPEGATVAAAGPGTVIWATSLTTYGGLVMIDHGGGDTTYYAHLSRIDVRMGQKVTAGQKIGAVGVANVAHLHFQIFIGARNDGDSNPYDEVNSGTPVDPLLYVSP